jgi:hypothetical protein
VPIGDRMYLVEEGMKLDVGISPVHITINVQAVQFLPAVATWTMPDQQSCRRCEEGGHATRPIRIVATAVESC